MTKGFERTRMPFVEHVDRFQKATKTVAPKPLSQNPLNTEEHESARYLTLTTTFYSALKYATKGHCLNTTEYRILIRLISHSSGLTATELSDMLNLTPSTITLCVTHLKQLGALERRREKNDRRSTRMFITVQGVRFVQEIRDMMAPVFERALQDLPMFLQQYIYQCTICVGETHGLFSREYRFRPLDVALSDEVFMTAHTASQVCAQHSLSLHGFQILHSLKDHPVGLRPGELAKMLHDRPNNVTATNKQLLKANLVRQSNDPIDNRASLFEITSDGWQTWTTINRELSHYLLTGILPSLDQEDLGRHEDITDTLLASKAFN